MTLPDLDTWFKRLLFNEPIKLVKVNLRELLDEIDAER